jgi:hypothetical protein
MQCAKCGRPARPRPSPPHCHALALKPERPAAALRFFLTWSVRRAVRLKDTKQRRDFMAYDEGYGGGRYRGRERGPESDRGYGRERGRGGHPDDDRGFFERAGDELRSWFGDDEAERRRDMDEGREGGRGERDYGRPTRWQGDSSSFGGGWGNQTPPRSGRFNEPRRDRDEDRDERYGSGVREGHGGGFGPSSSAQDSIFGAPSYDPEIGGPRFDRADPGHTGTHGVHPVASASGGAYGGGYGTSAAGFGSSARRYASTGHRHGGDRGDGGDRGGLHDPHYSEWRNRQIEEIDRDYEEYRREHASRFERDFAGWRERRGEQRRSMNKVREHMEVIGSDGKHIGTVDKVRGEHIVLTRKDENAGGIHHSIPCGWIDGVDDKVRVNKTADEAMKAWREEDRSRALFEREDQGSEGPHMLNRSFSGTYRDQDD